jgi:transketolase
MHHRATAGHIGGNLSALDAMMVVFHDSMGADDQFILSKGHAAGALYVTLWSKGLLTDQDLDSFQRDGTQLAGHPPPRGVPGVEFATGSLGHGLSLASGLALSRKLRGDSSRVFCLTSDGEWQEGSTWEALIFAAHHRLGGLTVLIDRNGLQGFGTTDEVASMHDIESRLKPFGVEIVMVDGHDPDAIRSAVAKRYDRPQIVILDTVKGRGVGHMQGQVQSHYLPLNEEQFALAYEEMGLV